MTVVEAILAGAVDLHVHGAPDIAPRRHSDLEIARRAREHGMAAVVLKSHVESTVGRAALAAEASGMTVYGGLVLNQFVTGGINPDVAAVALELGARVIWLASLGSEAHLRRFPRSAGGWDTVRDHPAHIPDSIAGWSLADAAVGAVDEICRLVAGHGAALATGHLSAAEISTVARAAERRAATVIVTHPDYAVPSLSTRQQHALSLQHPHLIFERAAYVVSAGSPEPRPLRLIADGIRATGVERNVLSSDLGQPDNPEYPLGFAEFLSRLEGPEEGFGPTAIRAMSARTPGRLLGII